MLVHISALFGVDNEHLHMIFFRLCKFNASAAKQVEKLSHDVQRLHVGIIAGMKLESDCTQTVILTLRESGWGCCAMLHSKRD